MLRDSSFFHISTSYFGAFDLEEITSVDGLNTSMTMIELGLRGLGGASPFYSFEEYVSPPKSSAV